MSKWLDDKPKIQRVLTWGKPWEMGSLTLKEVEQNDFVVNGTKPVQTDILAYWPDGSIKWTEHVANFTPNDDLISLEKVRKEKNNILAQDKFNAIYIKGDQYEAKISKHSDRRNIVDFIKINDKNAIQDVRLYLSSLGDTYVSFVENILLKKNGSQKAVIEVTGKYQNSNKQNLNEFSVYLTFYKETSEIDISYTLKVTDDRSISSVNLSYFTPQSGDLWNRHVGVVGSDSIYFEGVQSLFSRRNRENNEYYRDQIAGKETFPDSNGQLLFNAKQNAIWDIFSVAQTTPNHFEVTKKTNESLSSVKIGGGNRYSGSVIYSCEVGAIQVHLDKFWEKYPSEIKIENLASNLIETKVFLWSEKSEPMEFQHYDYQDHMYSAYEGMEENRSTPIGIANTSSIRLKIYSNRPTDQEIYLTAQEYNRPAIVIEDLQDYHDFGVFGIYSMKTENMMLENQLNHLFEFYKKEVEQREWYGFWNYGDFMHSYDAYRHNWLYDFGGYAWQNTELVPNMWLWIYFLRTGRRDVYELAEAMTKHTSEVDIYHSGEYKGLGSRHNVVHWGCQAKEARVSMAGLHRYYYFLTGDPRTKEIIHEVADNEKVFNRLEPLREFYERQDDLIPIRTGPDWVSLVSNWFTNWEISNDNTYKDKIEIGINNLYQTKNRLLSGPTVLFNPKTYELSYYGTGNVGGYHMIISFGGPEVWIEYAETTNNIKLKEMIAEFGRFYPLSDEEMRSQSNGELFKQHFAWPMFATTMMAYSAKFSNDAELAKTAWRHLLEPELSGIPNHVETTLVEASTWKTIQEMPWITTNVVSQWCLNTMICLELIGDKIPEEYIKGEN